MSGGAGEMKISGSNRLDAVLASLAVASLAALPFGGVRVVMPEAVNYEPRGQQQMGRIVGRSSTGRRPQLY